MKTPLSIIKGFAEGLEDGVSAYKQDHYIKVIIEEADKMEFLVKNMLDLARLESGTIKLRKSSFMLSELTEKVTDKLVHLLSEKHLEVIIIPANELGLCGCELDRTSYAKFYDQCYQACGRKKFYHCQY